MTATLGAATAKKGYKGLGMDGPIARWYARTTGKSIEQFRIEARALAAQLAPGSSILEVAPGPGYLAIELARARQLPGRGAGHQQDVRRAGLRKCEKGRRLQWHFSSATPPRCRLTMTRLTSIVCRAAFKNFSEPIRAIAEMHRVLKSGGKAFIIDLRADASPSDIAAAVDGMNLSWLNSQITKLTFKHMLLKRAHSKESIRQMAAQTPFETCEIHERGIGLEITLMKA